MQRDPGNLSFRANKVTEFELEEHLLKTITRLRLPFRIVEDPTFQGLLNLVHSDPQELEIPSAKTLRRHLRDAVTIQQDSQFLPSDVKVSLALDWWSTHPEIPHEYDIYFVQR